MHYRPKDQPKKFGDPKPIPTVKEKKKKQYKRKPTGEGELFNQLFEERSHVSFLPPHEYINNIDYNNCAHVLPKAKNKYPLFKLEKKYIVFLTKDQHYMWDFVPHSEFEHLPEWKPMFELEKEAKEEYKKLVNSLKISKYSKI